MILPGAVKSIPMYERKPNQKTNKSPASKTKQTNPPPPKQNKKACWIL